jgi:hypothetical protein
VRIQVFLDLLQEIAALVEVTIRLARTKLADDLYEQTRETPTLDSDVKQ